MIPRHKLVRLERRVRFPDVCLADAALRNELIELIETVVIYKLAQFSREEIQAMLQVKDIRETRVYQEAMEEGKKEKAARTIINMAAKKMAPGEIAALVEEDIEFVHQVLKSRPNGSS